MCFFLSITVWSVLSMMALKFTGISLPTKVTFVNKRNDFISLVIWFMFQVCIKPFCLSVSSDLWSYLNIVFLNRSCNNLVLWGNDCYFNCVWFCLDRYSFLHIVVGFLAANKTLDSMICHSKSLLTNAWDSLNKSNHGFITFGIELSVVTCFKVCKFGFLFCKWVLWNVIFKWIPKVSEKS